MAAREIRPLTEGYSYLKCPRWHDGQLWVSDYYSHEVLAIDDQGRAETIVEIPGQPSGLGWMPDGSLLVISMLDQKLMRLADGVLREHSNLWGFARQAPNDLVVDDIGRAYVGSFGFDVMAADSFDIAPIAIVEPNGWTSIGADSLRFPNGLAITPDGETLIVCESLGNRISAFDIRADGSLGIRRDWANLGPATDSFSLTEVVQSIVMAPDGCCLDAEGALWFADVLGCRMVRMAPGGRILEEIDFGDESVFGCMLGGPEGRTLYVTAAPDFHAELRSVTRESRIVQVEVDVPRAGRP